MFVFVFVFIFWEGLLFSYDITHEDTGYWGKWEGKHEVITIPQTGLSSSSSCNMSYQPVIPFINGEMYIVLEVIDNTETEISVSVNINSCDITQCPINSYESNNDCIPCQSNHFADAGSISSTVTHTLFFFFLNKLL